MIKLIKSLVPYKKLPFPLKKIVSKLARIDKPRHIRAFPNSNRVLNCRIAYNKYGGYCTPLSSYQRPVVQQILKGRVHELETIDYMRENCGDGDIVHAGTYFGDFLPGISLGVSKDAKIWAYEPNFENYRCAQITMLINGLENVVLKNVGLGVSNSTQKMLVQTNDGVNLGGASRIVDQKEKGTTIDIDIVSIDSTIPVDRNVSIIQLDVEGYETEALQGALNTIKRCRPLLILEDNYADLIKTEWFVKNIVPLGYEVAGVVHLNTVLKARTI